MADIAVIAIHGMGTQGDGFSEGLRSRLVDELDDLGSDTDGIHWKEILWADILSDRQSRYLTDAQDSPGPPSSYFGLRPFVVHSLGDAAAYQVATGRPGSTYEKIHQRISDRISDLYQEIGSQPAPTVVFAHSLGSHIISNYIWDAYSNPPTGPAANASDFERLEWLAAMITFGSNIPLFTFAFDPVTPIQFPRPALPEPHRSNASWHNYYDRHDILGYPLKPISPEYADAVTEDHEINAGGLIQSVTPLSHVEYWTDNTFVKEAAQIVARFL